MSSYVLFYISIAYLFLFNPILYYRIFYCLALAQLIVTYMYIALSYDHRIIDGRESVSFLVRVKNLLENPEMMLDGKNPQEKVLGF